MDGSVLGHTRKAEAESKGGQLFSRNHVEEDQIGGQLAHKPLESSDLRQLMTSLALARIGIWENKPGNRYHG